MNDEQQTITDPSANFALVIGTVTQNFPPRSGNGPALLKIKTERFGFGSHAESVFADYVPVTCWGQQRATCVRINIGDTVRAECRIGESKGKDDVWRVSITANSLTIFGDALGLGTPRLWRAVLAARERRWRARPGVRRVSQ